MVTARSTGSRADGFRTRFDTYLNDFATEITVEHTEEVLDGMNRVTSSTTTSKSMKADIQWINKKDLQHLNLGDAQIGDGMVFVPYNETIELEDEVLYNGERYRITSMIEGEQVGGEIVYKGFIIKVNKN